VDRVGEGDGLFGTLVEPEHRERLVKPCGKKEYGYGCRRSHGAEAKDSEGAKAKELLPGRLR
jgi:hypothetical protein